MTKDKDNKEPVITIEDADKIVTLIGRGHMTEEQIEAMKKSAMVIFEEGDEDLGIIEYFPVCSPGLEFANLRVHLFLKYNKSKDEYTLTPVAKLFLDRDTAVERWKMPVSVVHGKEEYDKEILHIEKCIAAFLIRLELGISGQLTKGMAKKVKPPITRNIEGLKVER